ncbi:hypothetical protein D3C86_2255400 [compost metagenome]
MPRGGHRPGAGRKAGVARKAPPIALRLSVEVLEEVDRLVAESKESRSEVVERLLRQALAIES